MKHSLHYIIIGIACLFLLHYIIIGIACLFLALPAEAARREGGCVSYTREDSITITRLLDRAGKEGGACLPLWFGRQLLGRPYVAATLELFPDEEQLIVNTRQLDCTTLVETVAALTICRQQGHTSFADYCTVLRQLRYRQGICQGYPSRLHYFSDWDRRQHPHGVREGSAAGQGSLHGRAAAAH